MDLTFTPEQEQFRLRVRQWFEENLPEGWGTPHFKWPESIEERKKWMREWERKLYEAGFAGLSWPKEYGGQGMTIVEEAIFNEEAGKLNAPLGFNVLGKLLLGPTLLLYGSEEQKKRFLPPLLRGEEFWCQGFSEPNAGSDLASLQTRAVLDGDEWVINGQKVWTSFAHYADWCFVLARTDPKAPKHKGITFFLVPMNSPGVTVRPLVQLNGNRDFNEVFFDDVRIPKENVVGGVNNGWKVAMSTLGFERGTLALGRQVRFQQELDEMARVSATIRTPDGSLAIDNPYYRQRLAQMQAEVRIFRYLCLKTISQLLNEGKLGPDASLQKLYWSTMHVRMGNLGMEILGPEAPYWGEDSVSRGMIQQIHLTSRGEIIYAGSSQIQKNIIAEKILGMPK
jgi:alkylation response protein AidB-like acyl-CoA dehydrogenase